MTGRTEDNMDNQRGEHRLQFYVEISTDANLRDAIGVGADVLLGGGESATQSHLLTMYQTDSGERIVIISDNRGQGVQWRLPFDDFVRCLRDAANALGWQFPT